MVTQIHERLCRIGFLCLIAGLFVLASTTQAQGKLPDLMPVVVNTNQGLIEVRNIGNAVAKPSQLFVGCSMFGSGVPSAPCAAGLNLPNYIKKRNILSYDIPALKPKARYRIHLFGSGALPRRPNNYGMKLTIDPGRRIAESNESNNYTRLDTTIKAETVSASTSSQQMPDLVPVIVNADQGIVQVRNIGSAMAAASKLYTKCRIYDSRGIFVRYCTARSYLPNFDANRLALNYSIPALNPGESQTIHLFGPNAWPGNTGRYQLGVRVDFGKKVRESRESNNSTSFTALHVGKDRAPGSKAKERRPDLIAVAKDPFFGIVYVENQGNTTAGKSKLLMICNQFGQNGGCATSSAMERIYDSALGGYVVDVPPVPAGKVQRVIFPMSDLTWDRGKYTFSLRADASGVVAESREDNNSVRRTLQWASGILRIVASSNGKPAPVTYSVKPSGDRYRVPNYHLKKSGKGIQTPINISLPTGVYQLRIQPAQGQNLYFNVAIKAGKVFSQKITFQQPGKLHFTAQDDRGDGKTLFRYFITKHGGKRSIASGENSDISSQHINLSSQLISLVPGRYDLHVSRINSFNAGFYGLKKYYANERDIQQDLNDRILAPEQEQIISDIHIQPGQTIEKHLVFNHIEAGFLRLRVKRDSKLTKTSLNITPSGQRHNLFSSGAFMFIEPLRVPLAPGRYRIIVASGTGGYQGTSYSKRTFTVDIKQGKTFDKTVAFTSQQKGVLKLTVLVNGSRSKAEISLRKAGSHYKFPYSGNVRASYNMISNKVEVLPGRYDVLVQPLEICASPSIAIIPEIRFGRVSGAKPVILHDVQVLPGKVSNETVKFKVKSHLRICH